jgi:hypothetical protein
MQTTVERLDKPSAYYLGRVRVAETAESASCCMGLTHSLVDPEQEEEVRS